MGTEAEKERRRRLQGEIAGLLVFAAAVALPLAALCWPRLRPPGEPYFLESAGTGPCASDAARWPALEVSPLARELAPLNDAEKEYLMELVLQALGGPPAEKPVAEQAPPPARCASALNTVLFVTLYGPGGARLRAAAHEQSLAQSALKAAKELSEDPSLEEYGFGRGRNVRVRIDILTRVLPLSQEQKTWLGLTEPGAPAGVALAGEKEWEFFLPADTADFGAATYQDMMRHVCTKTGIPGELWRAPTWLLCHLEAVSFVNAARGDARCLDTPRGLVLAQDVTPTALLRSCERAADYLVRAQRQDGSFAVARQASSGALIGRGTLNQDAAITYFLARAYDLGRKENCRTACLKALARIFVAAYALKGDPGMAVVLDQPDAHGVASLGAAALALCAFCQTRNNVQNEAFDDLIERLADFLLFMQNEDGRFELRYDTESEKRHSDTCTSAQRLGESSQAALGLILAYRDLGKPRFLLGASKSLEVLTAAPSGTGEGEPLVSPGPVWLTFAIREFLEVLPEERYAAHARAMADAAARMQATAEDAPAPDLVGSAMDTYPPAVGDAARNLEVLATGWSIALNAHAETAGAGNLADYATDAARYVIQSQLTPENSYFVPDSVAALGGFLELYGSKLIITDSVGHALNGLVELAETTISRDLSSDADLH